MTNNQITLSVHRAMNALRSRPDACMIQTNRKGLAEYYIAPVGIRVGVQVAEKIKAHEQVVGGKDALFPGLDQTWRMRTHAVAA